MPAVAAKLSKNQQRRAKKKAKKAEVFYYQNYHIDELELTCNKEQSKSNTETPTTQTEEPATVTNPVKTESKPEDSKQNDEIDYASTMFAPAEADNELFQLYQDVMGKFDQSEAEDSTVKKSDKPEIYFDEDDIPDEEEEDNAETKISKKKRKQMNKLSVAELKAMVRKPEAVEWTDADASDPKLLVHIKTYRNVVPVPGHWSLKREYLSSKRGIEKAAFQLPKFIQETGITEMRDAAQCGVIILADMENLPVDEHNRPLYGGDIFGVLQTQQNVQQGEPVEKDLWGELQPPEDEEEEEESEEEEDEEEEDEDVGAGLQTPSGLETPSGMISSIPSEYGGTQSIAGEFDVRKHHRGTETEESTQPRSAYQVIPERETQVKGFFGGDRVYDLKGTTANLPVLGEEDENRKRKRPGDVDVAVDPEALEGHGLDKESLKNLYNSQKKQEENPNWFQEDLSDMIANESRKRLKKDEERRTKR
ncbi:PSP family protein [Trichophyton tonsurans CBS 112818]|uniref:PSP family protein n=1 Tax=Trichophyton tonsurans (strain CBS 112818) TaxID=647933 RepID=F2RNL7_TRIT1|nr:PSP family protein [Trichophyton tonsurans CBS 112818]